MLPPYTQKCILVVEDDKAISDVIRLVLEAEGFTVLISYDGKIDELQWLPAPDLILMDIWLGDLNGIEICKRLKSQGEFNPIPVIIMSANANLQVEATCCGANDYLPKPFDIGQLIDKVERFTYS